MPDVENDPTSLLSRDEDSDAEVWEITPRGELVSNLPVGSQLKGGRDLVTKAGFFQLEFPLL